MRLIADSSPVSRRAVAVPDGFDPVPSIGRVRAVDIRVVDAVPVDAEAIPIPADAAGTGGERPGPGGAGRGLGAGTLKAVGFDGAAGQTHALAASGGPIRVAVGIGDPSRVDAAAIRDAAAAFALATKRQSRLALRLPAVDGV